MYADATGAILPGGATLLHPGLDKALRLLRDEGVGGLLHRTDRRGDGGGDRRPGRPRARRTSRPTRCSETEPRTVPFEDYEVQARGDDLDNLLGTLHGLELHDDPALLALDLVRALRHHARRGDTTSLAVVDADGNACAVTTSLGLSSGVWLADLGIHLNSMLGEGELVRGDEVPGRRMGSMMSPLVVRRRRRHRCLSRARPAGAGSGRRCCRCSSTCCIAACRCTRRSMRPGSTRCSTGCTSSRASPTTCSPRCRPTTRSSTWPALDSYFGGVAAIGVSGPGADPRRGGDVRRILSDST